MATAGDAASTEDRSPREPAKLFPRRLLQPDELRRLSRVNNWRGAAAVLTQWGWIAAAAALALYTGHWLAWLAAIVIIGTRQHALAILGHDAAHHRLFTHRAVNDWAANLLIGFPLGFSLTRYRPFHLAHHRHSFTDQVQDPEWNYLQADPDLVWPKPAPAATRIFACDFLGLNTPTVLRLLKRFSPWLIFWRGRAEEPPLRVSERIALVLFAGLSAIVLTLTNMWLPFLLLWIVPLLTVFMAVVRLRTIAEHSGLAESEELDATRTVLPSRIEAFLIAPCGVNYHLEHHLYPSVPCYNLPALHRRLMQLPQFRERAHITRGYLSLARGVLREVIRPT